jgi:capsular exopolysaccharide synthesis family protein
MADHTKNNNKPDLKSIILRFWKFRWIFFTTILGCLILVYFYNKFAQTTYENSIQMLIDIDEGRIGRNPNDRFQSIDVINETSNLDNELGKMHSFPLIKNALTNLNFETSTYLLESPFENKILQKLPYRIKREIYKKTPIEVHFYRSHDQLLDTRFYITILSDDTYKLKIKGNKASTYNYIDNQIKKEIPEINQEGTYKFGEIVESEYFKFYIDLVNKEFSPKPNMEKLYFIFHHMDYLTLYYLDNLEIETSTPTSSLINLTISGNHHKKITEFLNQLAQVYINKDLENKNRQAISTINFIENQISDVASSLSFTGNTLEQFRSKNRIVDLNFQGQMLYETLNQLQSEKASMLTQKKYYYQIREYIRSNNVSELVAPSAMNINDPSLNNLISRIIELNSERVNIDSGTEKNVYKESINKRIENLKNTILENVNTSLKNVDISLEDINYRIEKLTNDLSALPATELQLQSLQRKFELNDEIYTYLLTKHAEAQIAQASNFPSYEVVDPARTLDVSVVKPRRNLNYALALLFGLLLPAGIIMLGDFFNTKIRTANDIENITNIPVVSNIVHSRRERVDTDLTAFSHSLTSESIRTLRTHLQILNGRSNQIILITSSTSNEGKTFSSINLAKAYALLKKRIVLIGYDLRKPVLAKILDFSNDKGVSSFLAGEHSAGEIIQKTQNPYLDIITEGPLSPNPTELIASQKTKELMNYLKVSYDYIIIDTPPIGIVPDSKLMTNIADINLLVVRQTKTRKNELINTLKNLNKDHVSNFYIVLNDFSPKTDQYSYMYRYYAHKPKNKSNMPKNGNIQRLFYKYIHSPMKTKR